jgi:flagellar assembly protein FliH
MCDMSATARKNWGTIFMGADREVKLDQLSSVAPKGGGVWRRDQEETYLERVQRRAEEQARAILAQAGGERAALLEEARVEIARMREEAEQQAAGLLAEHQGLKDEAARLHEEARQLHEAAGRLRAAAEEAGHAAGIERARGELEHFRAVMGESTAAVLSAVHAQCGRIFDIWKEDVCALLLACVEKGTGLVLERDRALLLEQVLMRAVKLFEAGSAVLVLVRPEDEAVVAEMLAAAKERVPGLASWSVRGETDLAPGDLVLEAAHGRVESRVEGRRGAVDAALRHVLLPVVPEEEEGREALAQAYAGAVDRMLALVPERPLVLAAPRDPAADEMSEPVTEEAPPAEDALHAAEETAGLFATEEQDMYAAVEEAPVASGERVAPQVDLSMILGREATAPAAVDAPDAADVVDAVLAEGGFLPVAGEAE